MELPRARSRALFERAQRVLVGGVNSPVRAFKKVGGTPPFIVRARGAHVWDADGHEYIDYVGSWGPNLLGAAHPDVVRAVQEVAADGLSFGAPTEREVELAELVQRRMPSIERLRLVNSGTEATMSAVRVARAFTKRDQILKFDGAYHGHADLFLSKAGSGLATLGVADSAGVPPHVARDAHVVPYNDIAAAEAVFRDHGKELAAVIVEPVAGNVGVLQPVPRFLPTLRDLCDRHGTLLIFDEVITGFRVAPGGAQERYQVRPDLTCLGKILGGGLPMGAYGGRADVMHLVAPEGPVYQAGTLAGNPLSVAAGIATLRALTPTLYDQLETLSARLAEGLLRAAHEAAIPFQVNRVASMASLHFTSDPVVNAAAAFRSDAESYRRVFHHLLAQGIYLAPSPYEALFVSAAHTAPDLDRTVAEFRLALESITKSSEVSA